MEPYSKARNKKKEENKHKEKLFNKLFLIINNNNFVESNKTLRFLVFKILCFQERPKYSNSMSISRDNFKYFVYGPPFLMIILNFNNIWICFVLNTYE